MLSGIYDPTLYAFPHRFTCQLHNLPILPFASICLAVMDVISHELAAASARRATFAKCLVGKRTASAANFKVMKSIRAEDTASSNRNAQRSLRKLGFETRVYFSMSCHA